MPALRILNDELWNAVKERQGSIRASERVANARATRFWERRRSRHLLSGLVHCGECGSLYASIGRDYLACSAARSSGNCANRHSIRRAALEGLIIDALRQRLMAPELVEEFIRAFQKEINLQRRENDALHSFLTDSLGPMSRACRDGAIAYVCMDWRHMGELIAAGDAVFAELKNLCVWNKSNGGMGTFYRSKHELIFVYKIGTAPHVNSFGLGDSGRYRTNVWDYPGVSSLGANRGEAQNMHPTVKPTALVADAIRDCSRRGDIVLDGFGGSGTTLIAAETCGRSARLIEYDPLYCDTIVRRYERLTGKQATLSDDGRTFESVEAARSQDQYS